MNKSITLTPSQRERNRKNSKKWYHKQKRELSPSSYKVFMLKRAKAARQYYRKNKEKIKRERKVRRAVVKMALQPKTFFQKLRGLFSAKN